ncbi:MAG: phenylalanine--tRNA ligase subunit beta [Clostridiales bacterium]|nr:phenylalanine--tRNA ligase subunit beta [Clostridiales bacterium]
MLLSMNWIQDFVDLSGLDLDQLIHKFTLGTAEVEEVYHIGADLKDVVVAQVIACEPHPNSNKLHLLQVDAGDGVYQVVCGAPNVSVGIKVPFVKEGGHAGGMDIGARPIAGVESHGMCCGEDEILVSDDHSGLMILPDDTPIGMDIKDLYEIEDTVFEVDNKSLTNRPDLWGHYGIAREFAALSGRELKPFATVSAEQFKDLPQVKVEIENKEHCLRYSCMAIENVTESVSPVNMRIRLYRCGMRAINLLADLTNYIMLELGQPMHAFDYKRVSEIEVGNMPETFTFETLDGKERTIQPETLMIKSKGVPVAVAGIMGGYESEIVDDTNSFLLESANFDAVSIRKSSIAIGLRTDASMRYEKTLDPELTVPAIERYLYLLTQIDPGVKVISSLSEQYVKHYPEITITFDKPYVDRYTGIEISNERIEKTLKSLGFGLNREGDVFTVKVPSWRATKDISIKADIIEEITRIYGYDNFEVKTATSAIAPMQQDPRHELTTKLKDMLADHFGAHEVHTYIWNDAKRLKDIGLEAEGCLRLANSVSPDIELIRSQMVPTLLTVVDRNRTYGPRFNIFEMGSVVPRLKEDGLADEHKMLGVVFYGRKTEEELLFFRAKILLESIGQIIHNKSVAYQAVTEPLSWMHPYNSYQILRDGEPVGVMGVVHPKVMDKIDKKGAAVAIELDMGTLSQADIVLPTFKEPSRFPSISNDLSFIVPAETTYNTFNQMVDTLDLQNLEKVELVDIYQDPTWTDKKSVTLRFTFTSMERTLEAAEVAEAMDKLIEAGKAIGAEVKM